MSKMDYIDQSGLYAMEDVFVELINKDITILIVGIKEQPRYMLDRIDIIPDLVPTEQIFSNFSDCYTWIKTKIEDKKVA